MKKAILFAGLGLTVLAASCKKDETKTPEDLILGTWNHIYYAEDDNDNGKLDESEKEVSDEAINTFEFKEGGTLIQTIKKTTSSTPEVVSGTYSVSEDGKKITMTAMGFVVNADIETLNSNELFFSFAKDADFNKQWNYFTK